MQQVSINSTGCTKSPNSKHLLTCTLQTSLGQELDFSREASNAASLARRMRHRSYVTVPAPVPEVLPLQIACALV